MKIRGDELLVLVALEAGPWGAGHYTGLFHVTIAEIASYTGLPSAVVSHAVSKLQRRGAIVYDRDSLIMYVVGMLKRQSPAFASSENTLQGVANHVDRMELNSPATVAFIEAQSNTPELFELFEGYLQGEGEGDGAETLDLLPDTGDLRPGDRHRGKTAAATPRSSSSSGKNKPKGNGKAKASCKEKATATPQEESLPLEAGEVLLSLNTEKQYHSAKHLILEHLRGNLTQRQAANGLLALNVPLDLVGRLYPGEVST